MPEKNVIILQVLFQKLFPFVGLQDFAPLDCTGD